MKKDLLSFKDWSATEIHTLLELAVSIKQSPEHYSKAMAGKSVVALFEKPSLRTRLSFDIGINKLGGHLVYLDSQKDSLAGRESIEDMAANFSCWADVIVSRVFKHNTLEKLAAGANIPVVNALCDQFHPCQALADFLTLKEKFGDLSKVKLAYVGDGNNVSHSLLIVGAILGCDIRVITPAGFQPSKHIVQLVESLSVEYGGQVSVSHDLQSAHGVDVLYTDTWLSMGDETPIQEIQKQFMPFQLNDKLMAETGASYVMHCQPAHRGQEISGGLMDSEQSLLMQQAENRMYGQMAILLTLLN